MMQFKALAPPHFVDIRLASFYDAELDLPTLIQTILPSCLYVHCGG